MVRTRFTPAAAFAAILLLAACGGGGGGTIPAPGVVGGPVPGPSATATPTPHATATPTPTPAPTVKPAGAAGVASVNSNPLQYAKVAFSCGCNATGGSTTTDASGNYTIPMTSPAMPGPGTYALVPGRTYMIVASATPGQTEAWTMLFLGSTPSHNVPLGANNTTDVFTAATALYVFYASASSQDPLAYDHWNINSLISWEQHLHTTPNTAEQQLLGDIATAQTAGTTLFTSIPVWDPDNGTPSTNAAIRNDLKAVESSGDTALPTPCPSTGCTGAPVP